MLFIPIEKAKPGMILAKPIYLCSKVTTSLPLIAAGQTLTNSSIAKIKSYKIFGVYIESQRFSDIEVEDVIDVELRQEALANVIMAFEVLQSHNDFDDNVVEMICTMSQKLVNQILSKKQVAINVFQLKSYDDYTYQHSLSVSILSIITGLALGMKEQELIDLSIAALLHDVGKVEVPIEITNKPDKLTDEEFAEMKKHPIYGTERMKASRNISFKVMEGIYSHHERYNGTGYPRGISGNALSAYAKILAVADVYDALTSNRSYRKAFFPSDAIEFIMSNADSHFDSEIVAAFLKNIAAFPTGSCVELSNGEIAIVVSNTQGNPLRPVIRLLDSSNMGQEDVDLLTDRSYINVTIVGMGYEDGRIDYSEI